MNQAVSLWPGEFAITEVLRVFSLLEDSRIPVAFFGGLGNYLRVPELADVMHHYRRERHSHGAFVNGSLSDIDMAVTRTHSHRIRRIMEHAGYENSGVAFPGCPLQRFHSPASHGTVGFDVFNTPLTFAFGKFDLREAQRAAHRLPVLPDAILLLLKLQIPAPWKYDIYDALCLSQAIALSSEEQCVRTEGAIVKAIKKDYRLRWRVTRALDECTNTFDENENAFKPLLRQGMLFISSLRQKVNALPLPWELKYPKVARILGRDPTLAREVEDRLSAEPRIGI